jgi:hypothetical protein
VAKKAEWPDTAGHVRRTHTEKSITRVLLDYEDHFRVLFSLVSISLRTAEPTAFFCNSSTEFDKRTMSDDEQRKDRLVYSKSFTADQEDMSLFELPADVIAEIQKGQCVLVLDFAPL